MNLFLENVYKYRDTAIIVMPNSSDIEDYVMSLENELKEHYGTCLHKLKFIWYRDYSEKDKNNSIIIVDPRCYLEEIKKRDQQLLKILGEIEKICKDNQ